MSIELGGGCVVFTLGAVSCTTISHYCGGILD